MRLLTGNGWVLMRLKNDMIAHPTDQTWFKIIFDEFYHYLEDHKL
jgi:isopentenyl-diphosphate delta-isomerase